MSYCVFIGVHPRSLGHSLDSPWKDYKMRKGFTRQPQADEPATPVKNYITPSGLDRLKDEHRFLLTRERPAVTEVVAWAASNAFLWNHSVNHLDRRARKGTHWPTPIHLTKVSETAQENSARA